MPAIHKFTNDESDFIISTYKNNIGTNSIAKHFDVTPKVIINFLRRNNIKIRFPTKLKYVNENYFDKINTEYKAYFLGWLFTDGCISDGTKRAKRMMLSIQERDGYILEKFKKCLKYEGNITIKRRLDPRRKHHQKQATLDICSNKLCDVLINKYGCVPRKSLILKFPKNIPKNLIHHFIRGIFDGDGSIHSYITKKTQYKRFTFDIYGTKNICQNICKILCEEIGLKPTKVFKRKNANCYMYSVSGNRQIEKIYRYLYKDKNICLMRKEYRFKEVVNLNQNINQSSL